MLPSPITVTIDGTAHALSRINQDNFTAVYLKKLESREIRLTIRHAYEKASVDGQYERHNVDLVDTSWGEDGKPVVTQSYEVIRLRRGQPTVAAENVAKALGAFVAANVAAIAGWES